MRPRSLPGPFPALLAVLLLGAALAGGSPVPAADPGQGAIDTLAELGRRLRAQENWTARYRQEYVPVGMTRGDTADGTVWLAWPDRALFHTGDPPMRLMGLADRTVRLVDLELGTCEEHRLTDREWERIPLVAVLDPAAALQRFRISLSGPGHLVLVPLEPGGVSRAEVLLGDDGLPAEVIVTDTQGTVNRLHFSGWSASGPPPGGHWLPEPPDAVTCVRDGTPGG